MSYVNVVLPVFSLIIILKDADFVCCEQSPSSCKNNAMSSTGVCPNVKMLDDVLVRKRRGLAFPDGSDVVITMSTVKSFIEIAPSGWNLAIELDLLYKLPDSVFRSKALRQKLHHVQRRELWKQLEDVLSLHSFNGEACIQRALCEIKGQILPSGRSVIQDIMRAAFRVPTVDRIVAGDTDSRSEFADEYSRVYEEGYCETLLQNGNCPLSIFSIMSSLTH